MRPVTLNFDVISSLTKGSLDNTPVGIQSVLPSGVSYTLNEARRAQYIGIKNNLRLSIYVLVLSSVQEEAVWQSTISPGKTNFWHRRDPEIVLVSIGSAPGVPRAFLGKVGHTLHIDNLY